MIERYAKEKLNDLVQSLFVGIGPAREKLSENLHYIAIISPSDFESQEHQNLWSQVQKKLLGKTKNIWLERNPVNRLTVQNKTLEYCLQKIWYLYEETCNDI